VDVEAGGARHLDRLGEAKAEVGVQFGMGLDEGLLGGVAGDIFPAEFEQAGTFLAILAALVPIRTLSVLAQIGAVLDVFEIAAGDQLGLGQNRYSEQQ